jgi:hypothetical protein
MDASIDQILIIVPFQIQIAGPILLNTFSGDVTGAEFIEFAGELKRVEGDFERVPNRLTDLSGVTTWETGYMIMDELTRNRRAQVFSNKFRSAIVGPTPHTFGIGRMFQSLNDNPQIEMQVFKTKVEAEEWLMKSAVPAGC